MVDMMMDSSNSLEEFLNETFKHIENKIEEIISDENIITILEGGKRLRPLLGAIAFKTCTGGHEEKDKYQKFLEGCVGVELAHGASLVHDDIIDGDINRRGEPAFYIKSGIDNAILIGHKMLTIGFDIAIAHGEKFARLYVDSWRGTLNGQLREINFNAKDLNDAKISADSKFFQIYSKIIDLKTATLFSSSCKAAAFWADASEDLSNSLANYGREVGFVNTYPSLRESRYPAATGIGSIGGDVSICFLASSKDRLRNIENPRQVPAYKYPKKYGEDNANYN